MKVTKTFGLENNNQKKISSNFCSIDENSNPQEILWQLKNYDRSDIFTVRVGI